MLVNNIHFISIALLCNLVFCQTNTTNATSLSTITLPTTTKIINTISTTNTPIEVPKLASTCTLNQASPYERSLLSKVLVLDKKK